MTTVRIPLCAPEDGKRLLRSARLFKMGGLPAGNNAHYVFRFGVVRASTFTTLATYNGLKNAIEPGAAFPLTGSLSLDRALLAGDVLALEVDRAGSPPSLADAMVEWTTTFRTALAGQDFDDRLAEFFVRSGVLDRRESRGLGGTFPPIPAADDHHSAGAQAITAGGATENGTAAVTVVVPSGGSVYVKVDADADAGGSGGTTGLSLSIGDGTTDHNTATITAADGVPTHISTSYAGIIYKTTTFRTRVSCTTANATLSRQTLSYLAYAP